MNKYVAIATLLISIQTHPSEIHTMSNQVTSMKLRPHTPKTHRRSSSCNILSNNEQRLFELAKEYPTLKTRDEIRILVTQEQTNINAQDYLGHTPLHKAALYATGSLYTYLVSLGAREDIRSYQRKFEYGMGMNKILCICIIEGKTPKELLECLPSATQEDQLRR